MFIGGVLGVEIYARGQVATPSQSQKAFLLFVALSAISIVCGTVIFVIWNIIAYFKQSDS